MVKLTDPTQEIMSNVIEAAATASQDPALWLKVATFLYEEMQKRSSFDSKDMKKYQDMCILYKTCTQPNSRNLDNYIPEHWKLDKEGCPLYFSTFDKQSHQLTSMLESLDKCDYGLKNQIIIIVTNIAELFKSLSKRTNFPFLRAKYREDGFEGMFMNELAMWLVVDLPRYKITEKATAEIVQRRIDYCEAMQRDVLVFRKDLKIANFKNTLPLIIAELKVLHVHLCHAHTAANFTVKVTSIDDHIHSMVRSTFNMLHLTLDEVQSPEFHVKGFIKPSAGRAAKVEPLKKLLMGQWLTQTLEAAGINANDYMNTKPISHELIKTHIIIDFKILITNKINEKKAYEFVKEIGIPEFLWRTTYDLLDIDDVRFKAGYAENEAKKWLEANAAAFLDLIITLHRSILRLSYISTALADAKQVSNRYGEGWLFGVAEGQAMLDGLKFSLNDACEIHTAALKKFNEAYYGTYDIFVEKHDKDCDHEKHWSVKTSRAFHKSNGSAITKILELIGEINAYGEKLQSNPDVDEEKKRNLMSKLHTYLSATGYSKEKLNSLQAIVNSQEPPKPVITVVPPKIVVLNEPKKVNKPNEPTDGDKLQAQKLALFKLFQVRYGVAPQIADEELAAVYQHQLWAATSDIASDEFEQLSEKSNTVLKAASDKKPVNKPTEPIDESTDDSDEEMWQAQKLAMYKLFEAQYGELPDISDEDLEDVYQFQLQAANPDIKPEELAELTEKYDAALNAAKKHRLSQNAKKEAALNAAKESQPKQTGTLTMTTTILAPTTPKDSSLQLTKKQAKTALKLKKIFEKQITNEEWMPLTAISKPTDLKDLHLQIYNALETHTYYTKSHLISWWHGYSAEDFDSLCKHGSRMTRALKYIAESDLYQLNDQVQLEIVNRFLMDGIKDMLPYLKHLDSKTHAKFLADVNTTTMSERLKEKTPGVWEMTSLEQVAALSIAQVKAEAEKIRAQDKANFEQTLKLSEERAAATLALVKAEAEKARVEAEKARAQDKVEAEKARAQDKVEAEKARAQDKVEAEKARVEAEKARAQDKADAEKTRIKDKAELLAILKEGMSQNQQTAQDETSPRGLKTGSFFPPKADKARGAKKLTTAPGLN